MKRIIFLFLLISALTVSVSFGEVQEFRKFTLEIPEGWTVQEKDKTITLTKNNSSALISITVSEIGPLALADLAKAFSENLNGTEPKYNGEGSYSFIFNNGNGIASISQVGEEYILFVMDGVNEANEEITRILSTLKDK